MISPTQVRASGEKRRGLALLLTSSTAFGALPILAKLAYREGIHPTGLLAYRFALAAVVLHLIAPRGLPAPTLRTRLALWGLGAVFSTNAMLYFSALRLAPASVVVLLFYVYPVVVALLAAALGIERLTVRGLAAALLAAIGAALTTASAPALGGRAGEWLAMGAAVVFALYVVLGGSWASGVSSETATRHVVQAAAAVFIVSASVSGAIRVSWTPTLAASVLAIAVLCTVVALRTFLAGLARLGPAASAVVNAFEIPITMALAVMFLGERVGLRQGLGATLIAGAILLRTGRLLGLRATNARPEAKPG
jgi:drug/metabolite transporter (DMT)-like permease